MKFEVGQIVELVNNNQMSALKGATATVKRNNGDFIYVIWKTLSKNQSSGMFYSDRFKPLFAKNQQLLFSFME